jgi:hypothetical protein
LAALKNPFSAVPRSRARAVKRSVPPAEFVRAPFLSRQVVPRRIVAQENCPNVRRTVQQSAPPARRIICVQFCSLQVALCRIVVYENYPKVYPRLSLPPTSQMFRIAKLPHNTVKAHKKKLRFATEEGENICIKICIIGNNIILLTLYFYQSGFDLWLL